LERRFARIVGRAGAGLRPSSHDARALPRRSRSRGLARAGAARAGARPRAVFGRGGAGGPVAGSAARSAPAAGRRGGAAGVVPPRGRTPVGRPRARRKRGEHGSSVQLARKHSRRRSTWSRAPTCSAGWSKRCSRSMNRTAPRWSSVGSKGARPNRSHGGSAFPTRQCARAWRANTRCCVSGCSGVKGRPGCPRWPRSAQLTEARPQQQRRWQPEARSWRQEPSSR